MLPRTRISKWLKASCVILLIAGVMLVSISHIAIEFEQALLEYRAEKLLADFQQIKLHQSTWQDAQELMHRWGAWGHYDGSCTASDCRYTIVVESATPREQRGLYQRLSQFRLNWIYSVLGGRYFRFFAGFIVQDGAVWRTDIAAMVEIPLYANKGDIGEVLVASAKSRSVLHTIATGGWVLGDDEQLAQHPWYKAGRPGGCTFCMSSDVTYSEQTPQAEIRRLTSLNLSCITQIIPCTKVEDLMPAARDWHLYDHYYLGPSSTNPCDIPLWALGREATEALAVETIYAKNTEGDPHTRNRQRQLLQVKVLESLKGPSPWPPGSIIQPDDIIGEVGSSSIHEETQAGKHYILLTKFEKHRALHEVDLLPCGIRADMPQTRAELVKGFAQNDALRGPEL